MQALHDGMSSAPSSHDALQGSVGRESSLSLTTAPHLSSPTPNQPPRKRPSKDTSLFARGIGRELKLRKTDQDSLEKVASYSPAEYRIWSAAQLLKINEHQESQVLPGVKFELSKSVKDKIELKTFSVILDYNIVSYIDPDMPENHQGPAATILKHIIDNPIQWGFTSTIAGDQSKKAVLLSDIRTCFTKWRNVIKSLIEASFPSKGNKNTAKNIVELSKSILKLDKSGNTKLTVHHCVHFAFIRRIVADQPASKQFWKTVDCELEETRKLEVVKQSKFLVKLFEDDCKSYRDSADLDALGKPTALSTQQSLSPQTESTEEAEDDEEE